MIRTRVVVIATVLFATGCELLGGVSDQIELIGLVQRVSLRPGVDALDPSGPTAVGTDWRRVEFVFTEPISEAAAASFAPSVHLKLSEGLTLDSLRPPEFNGSPAGLIPPRTRLTLYLLPMSQGEHQITLKSPGSAPLEGESGFVITGSFLIRVSVVEKDGRLPFIRRFEPDQSASMAAPFSIVDWSDAGGIVDQGSRVAPHAPIRVTFSERMRTPMPIDVQPTIFKLVPTSNGTIRTRIPPGIDFDPSTKAELGRRFTVMSSATPEGMELDTEYTFTFHGRPALTSYQPYVVDRSGEPLTLLFDDPLFSNIAFDDTRRLRTAPIRLSSPVPGASIGMDAFAAGSATLPLAGEIADTVASVELSLLRDGVIVAQLATPTRTVTPQTNRTDVPIDLFTGSMTLSAGDPEGAFAVRAEAFDGAGNSLGADEIMVVKDTRGPGLVSGGSIDILVTDGLIPGFCVRTAETDVVRAEVILDGVTIASSTSPIGVVDSQTGVSTLQFCFPPRAVPTGTAAGQHAWTIRFTDGAGNVGDNVATLTIHPVLVSVLPAAAAPGAEVEFCGAGFEALDATDRIVFDGAPILLSHSLTGASMAGPPILASVVPGPSNGCGVPLFVPTQRIRVRVPFFAASGPVAFEVAGATSTSVSLSVCSGDAGPFVSGSALPDINDLVIVSDLGLTGSIRENGSPLTAMVGSLRLAGTQSSVLGARPRAARAAPTAVPTFGPPQPTPTPIPVDVTDAGLPVLFEATSNEVFAKEYDRSLDTWRETRISDPGTSGPTTGAIASARGPNGDVHVAYVQRVFVVDAAGAPQSSVYIVSLASRVLAGGQVSWVPSAVTAHAGDLGALGLPPPAVSLAFDADGRAAIAYAAPLEVEVTRYGLWVARESEPGSRIFSKVLVEPEMASGAVVGAVSAAFDPAGDLWLAYNRSIDLADLDRLHPEDASEAMDPLRSVQVRRVKSLADERLLSITEVPIALGSFGGSTVLPLWPSIAFDPVSGYPAVGFQRTSVVDYDARETRVRFQVENSRPDVAFWDGARWIIEPVGGFEPALLKEVDTLIAHDNVNLRVPRSVLRFAPTGAAKFAFARPTGEVRLSTRVGQADWRTDLAEVTPQPGASLALALDSLGTARLGYVDAAMGALRVYREEDGRAIVKGGAPAPLCASVSRFSTTAFSTDVTAIKLDTSNDFAFTIGNIRTLGTNPRPFDIFRSAILRHQVTLQSDQKESSFEIRLPNAPQPSILNFPPLEDVWIDRFEAILVTTTTATALRIRVSPVIFENELEIEPVGSAGDVSTVKCCRCLGGQACTPDEMQCSANPSVLASCFAGVVLPPLNDLGNEIRALNRQLPFLPIAPVIKTSDLEGQVERMRVTPSGFEVHAVPTERASGQLNIDLRMSSFELRVQVTKVKGDLAQVLTVGGKVCSSFDLRASNSTDKFRLRVAGAPAMISRELNGIDSARYGRPTLAVPRGIGLIAPPDLSLEIGGTSGFCEGTVESAAGAIRSEISRALGNPKGDLRKSLDALTRDLSSSFTNPLLDRLLFGFLTIPAADGRHGVVIFVKEPDRLTVVHERGSFLP